jgi:ascorbate PTS system EIIB component
MRELKVICVCGMGVGSSMLLKMALEEIFPDLDIYADIQIQNVGEFGSFLGDMDVVVTSELLAQSIDIPDGVQLITVNNFLDKNEIKDKVYKEFSED